MARLTCLNALVVLGLGLLPMLPGCADEESPASTPVESAAEQGDARPAPDSPWTIAPTGSPEDGRTEGSTSAADSPAIAEVSTSAGAARTSLGPAPPGIDFTGTYFPIPPEIGTLLVDATPDSLQAGWNLTSDAGGSWSGVGDATLDSLPVATYTISWTALEGWITPKDASVLLGADETRTLGGTYVEDTGGTAPGVVALPTTAEWTDHGLVLQPGVPGEWDAILWGGFTATAVLRNGTTFLYYQGARDYDEALGSVVYRTVGVATSQDGIQFEKYAGNPVLAWFPQDMPEEGAASAGAWLTGTGEIRAHYGANTAISSTEVTADGRLGISADGFAFADAGIAIDHADAGLFGSGDEIFPVVSFEKDQTIYCFYIPNGTAQRGQLGVAWGAGPVSLDQSAGVRASGAPVPAWGPGAVVQLAADAWAFVVTSEADAHSGIPHMDAYRFDPASPSEFSGPVRTWAFTEGSRGTVLLNRDAGQWYYYYRTADGPGYGLRTAPVSLE